MEKINGTNLGNWLVLEKWMSGFIFEGTDAEDETWLARELQPDELKKRMKAHRDTYITEADFRDIAARGYNLVRIPVPYFIFGDCPPFVGCIEYLDRAFDWAERHGLVILIDLHTVPGSQNGYDNGGLTGVCKWYKDKDGVKFALSVLERLAMRYGTRTGLYGIEVLNEPISWSVYLTAPSTGKARDPKEAKGSGFVPMSFLKPFYRKAYQILRANMPEDKVVVFHDGFRLNRWGSFFEKEQMKNVVLDTHIYIFAMENFVPIHAYWVYAAYIRLNAWALRRAGKHIPVVIGEWCIANQKARSVKGATPAETAEKQKKIYQRINRMQMKVWNQSAGQIYWNYQLYRDHDRAFDEDWKNGWDLTRCWKNDWL